MIDGAMEAVIVAPCCLCDLGDVWARPGAPVLDLYEDCLEAGDTTRAV